MILPALLSETMSRALRTQRTELFDLVNALGSPLFCLLPTEFIRNIREYLQVFENHGIPGRVWYAAKVNKSNSFLEVLSCHGAGADIASQDELQAVLGRGVSGRSIGVSGPAKTKRLLLVAALHQCTIALDSLAELAILLEMHAEANLTQPCDVFVRISGFSPSFHDSRFGVSLTAWPEILRAFSSSSCRRRVRLSGISFHIDNHSLLDRQKALQTALCCGLEAKQARHPFKWINVGGGIPNQYISHQTWNAFADNYCNRSGNGVQPTFRGHNLGIKRVPEGFDSGNLYPHGAPLFKGEFLSALIDSQDVNGKCIADEMRINDIGMIIEPGRSLLDQSGFTVCRVKSLKHSASGTPLVCVDMNISHMWDQVIGSEFAVDPILFSKSSTPPRHQREFEGHVVGNLCLESDIITWRKVSFPQTPEPGDLLVFPNTAGYQMDFIESCMHRLPLPNRVSFFQQSDKWMWKLDREFSVFDILT